MQQALVGQFGSPDQPKACGKAQGLTLVQGAKLLTHALHVLADRVFIGVPGHSGCATGQLSGECLGRGSHGKRMHLRPMPWNASTTCRCTAT